MHSYQSYDFFFSLNLTLLCQLIQSLWIRTNEPDSGMCTVKATTQLNVWPRLCRAKSTLAFANSFGPLDHFKVDCKAEELAQGLHLKDTGFEKDSPASSVPRAYYEPPTSSMSEVGPSHSSRLAVEPFAGKPIGNLASISFFYRVRGEKRHV